MFGVPFIVTHRSGAMETSDDPGAIRSLLAELDDSDPEHPDVSVSTEEGWTLSAFASGLVVFENVETGSAPRHKKNLDAKLVLSLMTMLAQGDLDDLEGQDWLPGYG